MHEDRSDERPDMEEIGRALRTPVRVGAAFDERVMAAVLALPRHARATLWARLTTPRRRTVALSPLAWGSLAAAITLLAALGAVHVYSDVHETAEPVIASLLASHSTSAAATQPVQFVLVAPTATKVAVVGDFNGWDAKHAQYQAQHRGGGVWSVTAPVPVGHHRYSFVVDDTVWVADPAAPRVIDRDFGIASSAMVVQSER